ncbi:hypothetical protein OWV82_021958 [Melia azedarach]|uniref:Uncharacterized protein n=1 Tax=Melia azedarach TaxID=155640 RepID=A0ACC1X369_MELAZ|nr:hypothetical protein OWV82_021958 [Melia azedarach]
MASNLSAQKAELKKELTNVDKRLQEAKDDGVNEEVDTVYKILRLKDLDYSITYIYMALGRDPFEVELPEPKNTEEKNRGQKGDPIGEDQVSPDSVVPDTILDPLGTNAFGQLTFGTVTSLTPNELNLIYLFFFIYMYFVFELQTHVQI